MTLRIDVQSALRPLTVFATLLFALIAAPAFAQLDGGLEGREYKVIVDPTGDNIHVATVWFGYGEAIWLAENKMDVADLSSDIELVDQGTSTVPGSLYTSYSVTTLSSTTTFYDAHTYERPSDSEVDFMMALELEASCSTDCWVVALDFVQASDVETNLESPSLSTYSFDAVTSHSAVSGDKHFEHDVH